MQLNASLYVCLFFLSLYNAPVYAEVYRWIDAEGKLHFGDRPPQPDSAVAVAVKPQPAPAQAISNERTRRMNEFVEQSQRARTRREAASARAEKAAQKRASICRRLQARVKFNQSISRFYRINDQGEREFYSDDEGQQIRNRYKAGAAKACEG